MRSLEDLARALEAARTAWLDAVRAREDGDDDLEALREEAAQRAIDVESAAEAILERLQTAAAGIRPSLEAVDALAALEEDAALEAERNARRGELAGAAHDSRERRQQLSLARDAIEAALGAIEEARAFLDR